MVKLIFSYAGYSNAFAVVNEIKVSNKSSEIQLWRAGRLTCTKEPRENSPMECSNLTLSCYRAVHSCECGLFLCRISRRNSGIKAGRSIHIFRKGLWEARCIKCFGRACLFECVRQFDRGVSEHFSATQRNWKVCSQTLYQESRFEVLMISFNILVDKEFCLGPSFGLQWNHLARLLGLIQFNGRWPFWWSFVRRLVMPSTLVCQSVQFLQIES